jgi:hypothetical protein
VSALRVVGSLVNGSSPGYGRVEMCLNGFWSGICGDGWNNTVASVACKGTRDRVTGVA